MAMHPAIAARILAPVVADLLAELNERMITMLPLYQCHKIVEASKIIAINPMPAGGPDNAPEGEHILIMEVGEHVASPEWMERHNPQVGGYFVKYPDGYLSYSPAKAFEEGYMALPGDGPNQGDAMHALAAMRQGYKVARRGWNGVQAGLNMFVVLMPELHLPPYNTQEPGPKVNDRTAKHIGTDTPLDSQPYFALHTGVAGANWQPGWTPSVMDCLANDWFIVE